MSHEQTYTIPARIHELIRVKRYEMAQEVRAHRMHADEAARIVQDYSNNLIKGNLRETTEDEERRARVECPRCHLDYKVSRTLRFWKCDCSPEMIPLWASLKLV